MRPIKFRGLAISEIGVKKNFKPRLVYNRYCLAGTGIENAEDFFRISDIGKTFDNVELFEENEKNDK